MNESSDPAARERLQALVGEWTLHAGPPGGPAWPGAGRVVFEWIEGAPLLIQRWSVDAPDAPNGVAVIGCDGMSDAFVQVYTDDRDVQRIYEMSLSDGVWKLCRDGEPFAQRFSGRFSADGRTIVGLWEIGADDGGWETDFELTYTRVGA